jgi:membrane fusion protein, adhesin transport system
MLNISQYNIASRVDAKRYKALMRVEDKETGVLVIRTSLMLLLLGFIILFLPWTQNIRADGNLTALRPEQRPQTIQSIIGGRIEKWYVQEGDFVKKGDTIIFLSEVKDEYFDPQLLSRTSDQIAAKEQTVLAYMEKVRATDARIDALLRNMDLKMEQTRNKVLQARLKVQSDSIDLEAARINYRIANEQLERMVQLEKEGLKSQTDRENRENAMQRAQANLISAENKLLTSLNEEINAKVELNSVQAKFREDIAKAESEKASAMSQMYDGEATVTKMQNQFVNYTLRRGMYHLTAPQDGFITQAINMGIGETVKEGEEIVSIMPYDIDLAVEMYIRPLDLPLIKKHQPVRIQFDGWPAIVFSGWPNTSHGTYGGKVYAIDKFISPNGRYRVLVIPDPEDYQWPDALLVGSGAISMVLLKDVPIWYELWRQVNGFPPDYYVGEGVVPMNEAKKAKRDKVK